MSTLAHPFTPLSFDVGAFKYERASLCTFLRGPASASLQLVIEYLAKLGMPQVSMLCKGRFVRMAPNHSVLSHRGTDNNHFEPKGDFLSRAAFVVAVRKFSFQHRHGDAGNIVLTRKDVFSTRSKLLHAWHFRSEKELGTLYRAF